MISGLRGLRGLSTGNSPENCLLAAVRGPEDRAVIGVLTQYSYLMAHVIWSSFESFVCSFNSSMQPAKGCFRT
jgi:hypothetical protein